MSYDLPTEAIMGLADKIGKINNDLHGGICHYQKLVDSMPEEDRKALAEAWAKEVSQRVILQALRSEGYKTSNEAIRSHRLGVCKCPKT
jgi:hypothetical protein